MLYYYAHTGHKVGLERLRRGLAMKKKLAAEGIEMQMLVNDFRAGVAMKEEQGLREYITIETIQDIDAVAQKGDSVIIDSDEDDHGRLVKYVADFERVWRFAEGENDRSIHGETLFREVCTEEGCEEAVIIDEIYRQPVQKENRILFFLGDCDHDKRILNHRPFFEGLGMELLLGHYFFVKYEDALAALFDTLHEAETYMDMLTQSHTVVTASSQAALEAKTAGADVLFLDLGQQSLYTSALLHRYGIETVSGFDRNTLQEKLSRRK
jgi:hypothetical protein